MPAPYLGYKKRVKVNGVIVPEMSASVTHEGEVVEYTNGVSLDANGLRAKLIGLLDWNASLSGKLGAKAGYKTQINQAGTPTALTDEPMTLVSGKTYEVTNSAKRCLAESPAPVFEDNGTPVDSADIEEINYLFGRVTFTSGYSVTGPITVASGNYIPLAELDEAREFELGLSGDVQDATTYAAAQANNGTRINAVGLIEATLNVSRLDDLSGDFLAAIKARVPLLIENSAADGLIKFRGWWLPASTGLEAGKEDIEMESLDFELAGEKAQNFAYLTHADFNAGLKALFDNFFGRTAVALEYLPDGTNGYEGDAFISSISMSGDVNGVDEFEAELVSAGELTVAA